MTEKKKTFTSLIQKTLKCQLIFKNVVLFKYIVIINFLFDLPGGLEVGSL